MATLKQMKRGLELKPTYDQVLASYLSGGPVIKQPDRTAQFIRESPEYQQLFKVDFIGLQKQQENILKEQKKTVLINEQVAQSNSDVKSVKASRGGSSMASAVSQIDDDLQSLKSYDVDLAFQYESADAYLRELEKDLTYKIVQQGGRLIKTNLDEINKQNEYLGGLGGAFDPQTMAAMGSASSSAAPQQFDISDEGQEQEVAPEKKQREFLQKQTVTELKKYAQSLSLRVPAGMLKNDIVNMIVNPPSPEADVEPKGKAGNPGKY